MVFGQVHRFNQFNNTGLESKSFLVLPPRPMLLCLLRFPMPLQLRLHRLHPFLKIRMTSQEVKPFDIFIFLFVFEFLLKGENSAGP